MLNRNQLSKRRIGWNFLIVCALLPCLIPISTVNAFESPDFPQGLILEFEVVQKLGFNTITLNTLRFVFNNWIIRNSLFSLILFDDDGTHSLEVTLPDWRAVYTDETEYGYLKPLWMNCSTWKLNDNVSIGSKGIFRLAYTRTEETDVGDFSCWVARQESSETHQYEHYYYNVDHGALIGHWRTDMSGMSINSVTYNLIDTNLEIYDPVYGVYSVIAPLDLLIILGIVIELVALGVIWMKKR